MVAEAEQALTTVDSEFGRTTDPVRMYMREMGSVDLLTREGEIEIAKRIEEGLRQMVARFRPALSPFSKFWICLPRSKKTKSASMN